MDKLMAITLLYYYFYIYSQHMISLRTKNGTVLHQTCCIHTAIHVYMCVCMCNVFMMCDAWYVIALVWLKKKDPYFRHSIGRWAYFVCTILVRFKYFDDFVDFFFRTEFCAWMVAAVSYIYEIFSLIMRILSISI